MDYINAWRSDAGKIQSENPWIQGGAGLRVAAPIIMTISTIGAAILGAGSAIVPGALVPAAIVLLMGGAAAMTFDKIGSKMIKEEGESGAGPASLVDRIKSYVEETFLESVVSKAEEFTAPLNMGFKALLPTFLQQYV